ncbi:hypothetical protein [Rhodoferax sp.]|uniref:hypothetical protein n=1 Tax=Rhodoferax sp. TaxID=50421 RepID=UPI0027795BA5|nr:hypothetical protein [Rhodoferax sp.]
MPSKPLPIHRHAPRSRAARGLNCRSASRWRARADHASLGEYHDKHAATARAAAAEQRKMTKAYGSGPVSAKGGMSMAAA